MGELLANGYEALRRAIDPTATHEDFNVIELEDDSGTPQLRLTTSDSRVTVASNEAANPYTLQATLSPTDTDVSSGDTFGASVIYKSDTDGDEVTPSESFTAVTLQEDDDELVVDHDIEVPQI